MPQQERLNADQLVAIALLRFPQIPGLLCIEPKGRGIAEQAGEPQRHQGRDRTIFFEEFMDRLARTPRAAASVLVVRP